MITAPLPMVSTGILSDGLQTHGRSLLVWPDRLDVAGVRLLRRVVPLGARVVVFGSSAAARAVPVWPGPPLTASHAVYQRWAPTGGDRAGVGVGRFGGDVCPAEIQALHRAGGLTPLPASVLRADGGWRHAVVIQGGAPVAVASAQQLAWPLLDTSSGPARLVAAVAVATGRRRSGLGRSVVDGVAAGADTAFALVADGDRAARDFFEALGWDDRGVTATYARWE